MISAPRHSSNLLRLPAALWGLLVVLIGLSACADPPSAVVAHADVRTEPARVLFHPKTGAVEVDVVNTGDQVLGLRDFRIDGPDWATFSFVGGIDPVALRPGERFTFAVDVDVDALREQAARERAEQRNAFALEEEQADDELTATAAVRFEANGVETRVPLRFEEPSWVWQHLVPALVKIHLLVLAFVMPLASLLTWLERKQSAMMQDRIGPNMARITLGGLTLRLWGLLHIATDGLKMLFKEDFIPRRAHLPLYTIAPLMGLVTALVVFAIIPFGDALCYGQLTAVLSEADVAQCADGRGGTPLQIAQIDVGLLYYFAVASLATYGTTLAGWSSYNKWGILGALRASAQMISYEVAIGLTIVGALLVYGTLEPHALVKAQLDTHWGIVLQPVAFILFFIAAIAETKRAPFDLPEGESEIIGYFIEYSGMRFGLFFLAEFIEIAFVSALIATIFLGGWALPFGILDASGFSSAVTAQLFFLVGGLVLGGTGVAIWRASKHAEGVAVILLILASVHLVVATWSLFTGWGTELPHIAVVLVGMITWGLKVFILCWLQLLIRWTLPRFRYDQLMSLGWKGLLPLSIANIVITAFVVYLLAPTHAAPDAAAHHPDGRPAPDVVTETNEP
jgi:NADH-quinone oxidoreductase subunit H